MTTNDPLTTIVEREVTQALEFFDLPELLAIVMEFAASDPRQPVRPPEFIRRCRICNNLFYHHDPNLFYHHDPDCSWVRARAWVDTNLAKAQNELKR